MYIDKIYIQDNFVPDIVTDQFRRKVIGVSVCLKEGEGTVEAEAYAEQFIKEYIQKNTVNPQVSGISEVAGNKPVPEVQLEKPTKEELQKKYLTDCKDEAELRTFEKLVKSNPHLQETYNEQFKLLSNGSNN